jgi:hypothetical protein
MSTHATSARIPAPRITTSTLRTVVSDRNAVAVQMPTGDVEAAPSGLTKLQSMNPDLVVVLDYAAAASFLADAAGDHKAAAATATAVLRWQHAQGLLDAGVEVSA